MALDARRRGDGDLAPGPARPKASSSPRIRSRRSPERLARAARPRRCRWCATGSTASTCKPGAGRAARELPLQQGREEGRRRRSRRRWRRCATSTCNDAFGTAHRAEATTHGIAQFAPGRLRRPAAGGRARRARQGARATRSGRWSRSSPAPRSRPSSRSCERWPTKVDQLIVGGGIANTFMLAAGPADRQVAGRARPGRRGARRSSTR